MLQSIKMLDKKEIKVKIEMKNILYFLVVLTFTISCKEKKSLEKGYSDLVLHDEEKKYVFRTFTDSLNIEHVKVFSSSENLVMKYRLFNDLKNGLEYGYYDSGNLEYKANFINDTLQGESVWYYDSKSKIPQKSYNYINGTVAGNQKVFYKNGNISRYFSTTYSKDIMMKIDYDENGKLIKQEGNYKTFGEFNSVNFRTDMPIVYRGFFSTPDHIVIDYTYSLSKSDEEDVWKKKNVLDSKIVIDTIISLPGQYIFKEKINISRKNGKFINTEFYDFTLEVIK